SWSPLIAGLEHDGGVIHIEGSVVCSAVGSANGTEVGFNLRESSDNFALLLKQLGGLRDGDSRESGRHIKRRTLEQGWHELTADVNGERQYDDQKQHIKQ